jgi:hypothetical protein
MKCATLSFALTVLMASITAAAGAEVPAQYRGLWCDDSKGYYRCRKATSEAYLHIRRDRINLSEEGDCRITAVTSSAKGHRLRVYCPRTYSRTHPNMSICGSTPAAASCWIGDVGTARGDAPLRERNCVAACVYRIKDDPVGAEAALATWGE